METLNDGISQKKKLAITCPTCGQKIETNGKHIYCENCKKLFYIAEENHFDFINNKGETVRAYYAVGETIRNPQIVRYEKIGKKDVYKICSAC